MDGTVKPKLAGSHLVAGIHHTLRTKMEDRCQGRLDLGARIFSKMLRNALMVLSAVVVFMGPITSGQCE